MGLAPPVMAGRSAPMSDNSYTVTFSIRTQLVAVAILMAHCISYERSIVHILGGVWHSGDIVQALALDSVRSITYLCCGGIQCWPLPLPIADCRLPIADMWPVVFRDSILE